MLSLILSRKCAAQTIPVDKEVLQYLFKESANAFYLRSDIVLCDSINEAQEQVITYKDSVIANCNERTSIKESQIAICELQNKELESTKGQLTKEVKKLKFISILTAIIGSISTGYFIFH